MLLGEKAYNFKSPEHLAGLNPQLILHSLVEYVRGKLYKDACSYAAVAFEDFFFDLDA